MAASTRPLTLGEILDHTVQIYRRDFLLFAGISFLPSALYVLVSGGASIYFSSQLPAVPRSGPPNVQGILALVLFGLLFLLVGLPLMLGILATAFGALNFAAFQKNRGEPVTLRSAYAFGFRHFWRQVGILFLQFLFAAFIPGAIFTVLLFIVAMLAALLASTASSKPMAILSGLLFFLVIVAMFVVCVWIWLRVCLAFPAAVTEDKKAWPSLVRSNQLTKGSRGRIFVMYLMVAILTVVSYYVLTLPVDIVLKLTMYKASDVVTMMTRPPILLQVVNLLVSCLERTFVMPIYAIALLLFYNDQRIRMEGYDIELLMANAGWSHLPPPPQAAYPPPPVSHAAASEPAPVSEPPVEPVSKQPEILLPGSEGPGA